MGSRWKPWELGYFDAFRGTVAVLPLLDTEDETFSGSEYLGLYPAVKLDKLSEWQVRSRRETVPLGEPCVHVAGAGEPASKLRDWTARAAS